MMDVETIFDSDREEYEFMKEKKEQQMNETKLLPCPFCGGTAVLYHQSSKYTDYDGDYAYCMNCGCRTRLFECFNGTGKTHADTEVEAINAWNRRATDERAGD